MRHLKFQVPTRLRMAPQYFVFKRFSTIFYTSMINYYSCSTSNNIIDDFEFFLICWRQTLFGQTFFIFIAFTCLPDFINLFGVECNIFTLCLQSTKIVCDQRSRWCVLTFRRLFWLNSCLYRHYITYVKIAKKIDLHLTMSSRRFWSVYYARLSGKMVNWVPNDPFSEK